MGDTNAEGDTVGVGLAELGVLVGCGVLVIVGAALVGVAVGVGVGVRVVGVTVAGADVPADEELAGVGLTSSQAHRLTRKIAMRTQVEVRISRSRLIGRSRPVRSRPLRSALRSPPRSAG